MKAVMGLLFVPYEFQQRSIDEELMRLAEAENRILITEDKDFSWLAFVQKMQSPGVILIRYPTAVRQTLAESVRWLIESHAQELPNAFVVLQPGTARIQTKPQSYTPET